MVGLLSYTLDKEDVIKPENSEVTGLKNSIGKLLYAQVDNIYVNLNSKVDIYGGTSSTVKTCYVNVAGAVGGYQNFGEIYWNASQFMLFGSQSVRELKCQVNMNVDLQVRNLRDLNYLLKNFVVRVFYVLAVADVTGGRAYKKTDTTISVELTDNNFIINNATRGIGTDEYGIELV